MVSATVESLLMENQSELLADRRAVRRTPFTRPVQIASGRDRDQLHDAFSRDISSVGVGLISRVEWAERTVARLTIHSVKGQPLVVTAEARWTQDYGGGWFLTGWAFIQR